MIGAKVRKGWRATPCLATFGTSRLPSLPWSRRRVLFCGAKRPVELFECHPNQSNGPGALSQEEESTDRPWTPQGRLFRTLSVRRPITGAVGDAVPHGPRAVHLHPARIPENSVLPRAESATGCIFRQPGCRAGAITYPRQVFPKHSPKCAETTVAGRGTAKKKRVSR